MKHFLRSSRWFGLAMAVMLVIALGLGRLPAPAMPLSALRLDPVRLAATLDRGETAEAVEQLEQGWKVQLDEYFQTRSTAQLLSAAQIAESLQRRNQETGKRSALIYAISLPDQLEVILVLPNGELRHHRVTEATLDQVNETAKTIRSGLSDVLSQPEEYLPAAQQLYQWLIAPFQPALQAQSIENLMFCLGRGLRSVPMAALHDGDKFLIESYSVSVIPAFTLLDRQSDRLSVSRVLAMGASEFAQEMPLPAVPVELEAIAQLWPTVILQNEQFTLAQLQDQRSRYPFNVVHLATHATFAAGSVQNSYIRFFDQALSIDRLKELDLQQPPPVQLLVLSACRTALGDANAELGFAGLAVQSGAKAALASLWSIADAATVIVMVDFYSNLKTAAIKVDALRETQLAMLQNRLHLASPSIQQAIRGIDVPESVQSSLNTDLSHPYYWAGFTMVGNPW